jgi:hypothetical protein
MPTKPEDNNLGPKLLHDLLSRFRYLVVDRSPDLDALIGIDNISIGKTADFDISLCNELFRLSQEIKRPSHTQLFRAGDEEALLLKPVVDIHAGAPFKGRSDFLYQF